MKKELLLVKFPFMFPIIYGFVLYVFPTYENHLIFLTILLLAETHFAATWPFFLNKVNQSYIKIKKVNLIYIPILIILFSLLGFFLFKNLFFLIFFLINIFHVTRQSYGISSLYCKNLEEKKFHEFFIYLFSFVFFLIAFFRFYLPLIPKEYLLNLNIVMISIFFLVISYYIKKFKFSEKTLILITGCLIFYPACFVSNPVHFIIMGVTMHYTQYLYLTNHVFKKRRDQLNNEEKSNKYLKYFFIIAAYSAIMSLLSMAGKYDESIFKNLLIIPIVGQMLHFYLDSQLWKFSIEHNRKNILSHLKELIN